MRELTFDRFLDYEELTEVLHSFATAEPDLLTVESLGLSFEGRDIWLCTITNSATGPHDEKPAIWIDANVHATELTGSVAALFLVNRLVTAHRSDARVARALDTRTFYIVPRISPDGAELALGTHPTNVRSSARPYPRTEQQDGLIVNDIDGDGRVLTMRMLDPNGAWKPCPTDQRLLVPRDPDEDDAGPYYRLLQEGEIQNFDGITIRAAPALRALDFNRNYPFEWRPEGDQRGAGPYPTSEPEIRAVVQAIVDRPNICALVQYHTMSGVHLRPLGTAPDDQLPTFDRRVYEKIGEAATRLTGYPVVSIFHDFTYDKKRPARGAADDWAYDNLGVYAWTTELWSPQRAAGITDYSFTEWGFDHPVDDDLKLLAWVDEHVPGEGFVDWYPFEHPQLGPVEIGGWNTAAWWRNPPKHLLEAEVERHADWAIWHALISPRLTVRSVAAEPIADGVWRVRLVVENSGWLPTNVTQKALDRKVVRPLEARIVLPDDDTAELVGNETVHEAGQLAGRALKGSMIAASSDDTNDRAVADWIVRATPGTVVQLEARHQRAGVVRTTVTLEA